MMKQINESSPQFTVTNHEQAYQISAWKAISIIGGAVIVSIVGTAFTAFAVINSDHFLLVSNTDRISALELSTVRKDVLVEQLAPMRNDILEMKADIKLLVREQQRGN